MRNEDDLEFGDASDSAKQHAVPSALQYLVVSISGLKLGVPLVRVSEALSPERFSSVPGAPDHVLGLIHVRERVVPVFDLSQKLGRTPCALSKRSCVLMLELELADEPFPVGVLMDGVAALLDVEQSDIKPPPRLGANLKPKHVHGVVTTDWGMLPLIDVESLFEEEELQNAGKIFSIAPSDESASAG